MSSRPGPAGSGDNAAQVLDDMMEAIHYEHRLYDTLEERAGAKPLAERARCRLVAEEPGRGGKDGSGEE